MNMLAKAIAIASNAHIDQIDMGGKPYILHPLWVMDKVRHLGQDAMIVAVLHDVIEDSPWSIGALADAGFNKTIMETLNLLTHDSFVDYEDYIKAIALNPLAKEIKLRDLEHNTKVIRLKGLRKKDFDRLEKYHKAYTYLKD